MQFNAQEPGFVVSFRADPATSSEDHRAGAGPAPAAGRPFVRRRRNRHGRGLRGSVMPAGVPGFRTRAEKFDDLVMESAERLMELWGAALENVEYLVEEVPDQLEALIAAGSQAPLGRCEPAVVPSGDDPGRQSVIIVYRHPVEALCDAPWQTRELVHEVLIEQVAGLLNIDPDAVDPLFRRFRGN
ncbi:metallopeptidase family protein [Specibacter sp. RAF43]|uniref:metallopeptidase family protein n=1 Tax=Specibacter sp. RAF43 TaxID=3233057 RepID=UPI003F9B4979